jgi:glucokinase
MKRKQAKGTAQAFRIYPASEKEQTALNIFELLKKDKSFSLKKVKGGKGVDKSLAAEYINAWVKKDLLEISGTGKEGLVRFNADSKKVLGVGFGYDECIISVMDLAGKVISKESVGISSFRKWRGKNKEAENLVNEIKSGTKTQGGEFLCAGIAVPEEMNAINPRSAEIVAKGMKKLFGCRILIAKEATAAAYGEGDATKAPPDTFIYLHRDIGIGAVMKKEMIFEASESGPKVDNSYLRPWNQFSLTDTAKHLIDKGIGTDIVKMVKGDIDKITLEVVLKSAEANDELAEDLVKRSSLALGVRAAYLVNMFNVDTIILGGGTEIKEGRFIDNVKESAKKFVLGSKKNKLKITPGVLGKQASSAGAASLCRRELFMMEV